MYNVVQFYMHKLLEQFLILFPEKMQCSRGVKVYLFINCGAQLVYYNVNMVVKGKNIFKYLLAVLVAEPELLVAVVFQRPRLTLARIQFVDRLHVTLQLHVITHQRTKIFIQGYPEAIMTSQVNIHTNEIVLLILHYETLDAYSRCI